MKQEQFNPDSFIPRIKAFDADYALHEGFDIQQAAQALNILGALLSSEASEQEEFDVSALVNLIYELLAYIQGEAQDAAGGKSAEVVAELVPADFGLEEFSDEFLAELEESYKKSSDPKKPYGDVAYADPGYQADKKKRYPIDTEAHIRAAWNYINKEKNCAKYGDKCGSVKRKIIAAWRSKIDKAGPPSAEKKSYFTGNEQPGSRASDNDPDDAGYGPSDSDADNFHSHAHVHQDGNFHEHTHEHDQLHGVDNMPAHNHFHAQAPKVPHPSDELLNKVNRQSIIKPPKVVASGAAVENAPVKPMDVIEAAMGMGAQGKSARDPHAVKSIGENRIAAYGVHYASDHPKFGTEKDLTKQYFTAKTWFGHYFDQADVYYHHGGDPNVGLELIGQVVKTEVDKNGVWVQAQLDKSNRYFNEIKNLIKQGRLFWSTGTAAHLAQWTQDGEIKRWPVVEISLTPTPAEPRLNPISFYKSIGIDADSLVTDGRASSEEDGQKRESARNVARAEIKSQKPDSDTSTEVKMDPKELAALVADSVKAALEAQKQAEVEGKTAADAQAKAKADAEAQRQAEIKTAVDAALAEFKKSLPASEERRPAFYAPNMNSKWGVGELSMARAVKAISLASRGMPDPWAGAPNEKRILVDRQAEIKANLGENIGQYGGFLVPPEWLQDQFIPLLRARAVVRQAGPRVLQANSDTIYLPTQTGGATAAWLGENATISGSNQTFGQVAINIKKLGALTFVSNELLADASPSVDQLIREDLAAVIAIAEDVAFLTGDGTANSPVGMLNWAGNQQNTLAADSGNGGAIAAADLFAFKRLMMQANIPFDGMAFFCSPRTWDEVAQLKDSQNRYLLESLTGSNIAQYAAYGNYPAQGPETSYAGAAQGKLFGWPVYVTANIPENITKGSSNTTSYMFFVRMADLVVAERAGLELMATNVGGTAFASDQTWIRAIERVGFGVRHAKSVVYANGLT